MGYLLIGTRTFLAGVFLVSFASKTLGRSAFAGFVASVSELSLFSAAYARLVAVFAVLAELGVFLMMVTPGASAATAGHLVALGLVAVFTLAIGRVVRRRRSVPCRCFGSSATPLGVPHVVRNLIIMAVAAAGLLGGSRVDGAEASGAVVAICTGLLMSVMVIVLDDIVELFRLPHRPR